MSQAARQQGYNAGPALNEAISDRLGVAWLTSKLAYLAAAQAALQCAIELCTRSFLLFTELGDQLGAARCLAGLAEPVAPERPMWAARALGAAQPCT